MGKHQYEGLDYTLTIQGSNPYKLTVSGYGFYSHYWLNNSEIKEWIRLFEGTITDE